MHVTMTGSGVAGTPESVDAQYLAAAMLRYLRRRTRRAAQRWRQVLLRAGWTEEDLFQESAYRVLKALERTDLPGEPRQWEAWVRTLVLNVMRERFRTSRPTYTLDDADPSCGIASRCSIWVEWRTPPWNRWTPKQRATVKRLLRGESIASIAKSECVTPQAIRDRLRRAALRARARVGARSARIDVHGLPFCSLRGCPRRWRQVIELARRGQSRKQIAERMGVSVNAVRLLLRRVRRYVMRLNVTATRP